jgi:hypothetical protein
MNAAFQRRFFMEHGLDGFDGFTRIFSGLFEN